MTTPVPWSMKKLSPMLAPGGLAVDEFAEHPRHKRYAQDEQMMGDSMDGKRPEGRVADDDLGQASCGGVPVQSGLGILLQKLSDPAHVPHQVVDHLVRPFLCIHTRGVLVGEGLPHDALCQGDEELHLEAHGILQASIALSEGPQVPCTFSGRRPDG